MINFLATMGVCVIATVLISIILIIYDEWKQNRKRNIIRAEQDKFYNGLINNSWWFSECPKTMYLIQDLAKNTNISEARENWRNFESKNK